MYEIGKFTLTAAVTRELLVRFILELEEGIYSSDVIPPEAKVFAIIPRLLAVVCKIYYGESTSSSRALANATYSMLAGLLASALSARYNGESVNEKGWMKLLTDNQYWHDILYVTPKTQLLLSKEGIHLVDALEELLEHGFTPLHVCQELIRNDRDIGRQMEAFDRMESRKEVTDEKTYRSRHQSNFKGSPSVLCVVVCKCVKEFTVIARQEKKKNKKKKTEEDKKQKQKRKTQKKEKWVPTQPPLFFIITQLCLFTTETYTAADRVQIPRLYLCYPTFTLYSRSRS